VIPQRPEPVSPISPSVSACNSATTISDPRYPCYHLPRYVHVCRTDDGIVFLDARRDRYFGLGGTRADGLSDLVLDWPNHVVTPETVDPPGVTSPDLKRLADSLVTKGLLCAGRPEELRREERVLPSLAMDPPRTTAYTSDVPRVTELTNFALACLKARWHLRRSSLESIASEVTAARNERGHSDFSNALELVQVFRRLRSLVFSEKNRCLFNALSLVYFLRRYGHFPYFVIGVKTAPFAAHSWVQQEQVVLDGDPASICHFVPILVA
jgi:hypothetical protein